MFNNKEHLCFLEGLRNCYAFTHVNIPSCPEVFCETLTLMHSSGSTFPCILRVHFCTCTSACIELALASLCSQWSSVVHMRMDPSCLLQRRSAFNHSFWVVSPPTTLPCVYHIKLLYQSDRCPSSLMHRGSWLECLDLPAMGAVSSRK